MNKKSNNRYDYDKSLLESIRVMNEKAILAESEQEEDAVAITDDAKFGNMVLQNQIDGFKQTVSYAAKFAKPDSENPKNNPLVYFPKTGNLVFSGSIPNLGNLRFQYSLNDSTGSVYLFTDGFPLNQESLQTIQKLYGFYKNWQDSWFAAGDLLEHLGKKE